MYDLKAALRRRAYEARSAQPDKEHASASICAKFTAQDAYRQADTVMWYCHCRSEVRTLVALHEALQSHKRVIIPYCTKDVEGGNKLGLWRLQEMSELRPGMWGILEPPRERWGEVGKEADPRELDLIMVPGVVFDRQGGRLGNGQGYYDRLLQTIRKDAVASAVCYESQLFDEVPMTGNDVYMDYVITEAAMYRGQGR